MTASKPTSIPGPGSPRGTARLMHHAGYTPALEKIPSIATRDSVW